MSGRPANSWRWRGRTAASKTASRSLQDAISTYNSETGSRINNSTNSRPHASRPRTGVTTARPGTARPRTGISTVNGQDIVCAISESRGVTPVVGLALLNLHTCEVLLCQINDNPQYARTIQKLAVFEPQVVVVPAYGGNPSKLHLTIEESMVDVGRFEPIDRQYFTEVAGHELLQQLAFAEDFEALRASLSTTFFAVCCFAAVIKFADHRLEVTFAPRSLRVTHSPSEGSMMIDESTRNSLELIQNLERPSSKACLFGFMNRTETPMGARYLRSNILQPSTNKEKIINRLNAVAELSASEEAFMTLKKTLKGFVDAEKVLTDLIIIPKKPKTKDKEHAVNRLIMLKTFIASVPPVFYALTSLNSEAMVSLRENCDPANLEPARELLDEVLNEDVRYTAKGGQELVKQRTYAIKYGIDGLMDVFRQQHKEALADIENHRKSLQETHEMALELKYDARRQFYYRVPALDTPRELLPTIFNNVVKFKGYYQCQTMELMRLNLKMRDCELEVLSQSEGIISSLTDRVREHMSQLYKCSEAISLLDMVLAFADLATSENYTLPRISKTLALKECRHPLKERLQHSRFIPNDVYATQQTRFQIVTGANMSGKSTYIRTVVLVTVMMQMGSFVPASHGSFPIVSQIFARTSIDDSLEANASTFALEMREMAFILRNIDSHSMVIVDELGRGTSPQDGLAIAIAISEALIQSKALVWFATHFKDLVRILSTRPGVLPLHMSVSADAEHNTMTMLYQISPGVVPNSHYGIAFARHFPFPPAVLRVASIVANALDEKVKQKRSKSGAVIRLRKRKLLLTLREQLEQAMESNLDAEPLREWLLELQKEFVTRMVSMEQEAAACDEEEAA